jgi:hypothetical protein
VAVQIRKLGSGEAELLFPRRGEMDLSAYTNALRFLRVGDTAEVDLAGLSARAMKRRLEKAAGQVGYKLNWGSTAPPGGLYLQVLAAPTYKPACGRPGTRAAGRADGTGPVAGAPATRPERPLKARLDDTSARGPSATGRAATGGTGTPKPKRSSLIGFEPTARRDKG